MTAADVGSKLKAMNLDKIKPMLKGEGSWGGRNRRQWGKLLLFYTLYFISIFGLFFLIVYWFYLGTKAGSDGTRPLLHGRGIQSPGINYQPRLANNISEQMSYISDNHWDIDSKTAFVYKSGKGDIYVDQMKSFLEKEGHGNLTKYGDFSECNEDKGFGFAADKPCLFFRINKVIDWSPLGIEHDDIEEAFSKTDNNILSSESYCSSSRFEEYCNTKDGKNAISKIKDEIFSDKTSNYDKPFVKCLGYSGAKHVNIKTYPENGELAWEGPFTGIDETTGRAASSIFTRNIFGSRSNDGITGYKTPLVAVQFDFSSDKAKNTDALFHCFVFDRNMEIETKKQSSGMVRLAARINTN